MNQRYYNRSYTYGHDRTTEESLIVQAEIQRRNARLETIYGYVSVGRSPVRHDAGMNLYYRDMGLVKVNITPEDIIETKMKSTKNVMVSVPDTLVALELHVVREVDGVLQWDKDWYEQCSATPHFQKHLDEMMRNQIHGNDPEVAYEALMRALTAKNERLSHNTDEENTWYRCIITDKLAVALYIMFSRWARPECEILSTMRKTCDSALPVVWVVHDDDWRDASVFYIPFKPVR